LLDQGTELTGLVFNLRKRVGDLLVVLGDSLIKIALLWLIKAAAFASGGGTNLQALIDHQSPTTPWTLPLLVCNHGGAGALPRARR